MEPLSSSSSSIPVPVPSVCLFTHPITHPSPTCVYVSLLQRLCKELDGLQAKKAALEQQVSALAQAGGDLGALEAASTALAAAADVADAAELEWLELAELAGDL